MAQPTLPTRPGSPFCLLNFTARHSLPETLYRIISAANGGGQPALERVFAAVLMERRRGKVCNGFLYRFHRRTRQTDVKGFNAGRVSVMLAEKERKQQNFIECYQFPKGTVLDNFDNRISYLYYV